MDITDACSALRRCNDCFGIRQPPPVAEADAFVAVQTIMQFLERVRADGKPIRELEISANLLFTPEGIRWVMPFVISVEGMVAYERRKQSS